MVSAVSTLRKQTLVRQINKCNYQLSQLTQQQQLLSSTSAKLSREYRQLYYYVNGLYGTISAEQEDSFTSKLEQFMPVYYAINEKDTEIDLEVSSLETQLKALTNELENLEKTDDEQAKDGAPHLSM